MTNSRQHEPLRLSTNPYPGPNAHLLSLQQTPRANVSLWKSFHNAFISLLTVELNKQLPEGYIATTEQSLRDFRDEVTHMMIRDLRVPLSGVISTLRLVQEMVATSDFADLGHVVSIALNSSEYQMQSIESLCSIVNSSECQIQSIELLRSIVHRAPEEVAQASAGLVDAPTWVIPIEVVVSDQSAALIHPILPNAELGEPIVRIELLSPSNKDRRERAAVPLNRSETIISQTKLFVIDICHESRSTLTIPHYPDAAGSQAYYIAYTDPAQRPVSTQVKGFDVDSAFPLINIVLLNEDIVRNFDLGLPYNQTFEGLRCGSLIDYRHDPDAKREIETGYSAIERYNRADQERIRERMRKIQTLNQEKN